MDLRLIILVVSPTFSSNITSPWLWIQQHLSNFRLGCLILFQLQSDVRLPNFSLSWQPVWFLYSRYRSVNVIVDGLSRSFEFLSLWESLPVVGCLLGSLTAFHGCLRPFKVFHLNCYFWLQTYSLPVVGGLSGSLAVAKVILFVSI